MSKKLLLDVTIDPIDLDISSTYEVQVRDWRWLWLRHKTVKLYVFTQEPRTFIVSPSDHSDFAP